MIRTKLNQMDPGDALNSLNINPIPISHNQRISLILLIFDRIPSQILPNLIH